MKYIEHKGYKLFPIGIGTWGIGGFVTKNPENDDQKQIEALVYMLQNGMNFMEANMWTAEGHGVELLVEAIKKSGVKREDLCITLTIYPYTADTVEKAQSEVDSFIEKIGSEYVDVLQVIHSIFQVYGKEETYKFLEHNIATNKCKYVSITNTDLGGLKEFKSRFQDKVFGHEVAHNFEVRENELNGNLEFATSNDTLNIIYQPIRRNRTSQRKWPLLENLSEKYGKTVNQILYNWIVSNQYLPITKSSNISHIAEAIESLNFEIEPSDIKLIEDFRPPNYTPPKAFFGLEGEGVRIDQLSNVFDEEYDKQQIYSQNNI